MASEKRLIDANPIVKFIMDGLNNPDKLKALGHDAIEILTEIEFADTVDAVEVVRCKDCKHWKHFKHLGCTDFVKVCGLANYMIGENGYCLYGERKDNE